MLYLNSSDTKWKVTHWPLAPESCLSILEFDSKKTVSKSFCPTMWTLVVAARSCDAILKKKKKRENSMRDWSTIKVDEFVLLLDKDEILTTTSIEHSTNNYLYVVCWRYLKDVLLIDVLVYYLQLTSIHVDATSRVYCSAPAMGSVVCIHSKVQLICYSKKQS